MYRHEQESAIPGPANAQRGVALVTALLLLLLLTGLSVIMVVSSNSDLLTNGYYRGFRGAFYAADSGLSVVRQELANQILLAKNAKFSTTQQAIAPGAEVNVQNYIRNTYGKKLVTLTGTGNTTGSWPESFIVTAAFFGSDPVTGQPNWSCTPIGGTGTCAAPVWSNSATQYGYQYSYPYSVTAQGKAQGSTSATIIDTGNINVIAMLNPTSSKTSFAAWGMFIDQSPICNGSTLVPGTITGPVFTNGAWNFGTSGNYIFTDTVGSANSNVGYQFSNKCDQIAGASDKQGKTTIAPTFQNGLNLGQPTVPLPPNDYNQEQAVLDGKGSASGAVTNAALHSALQNISGTAYPSGGAASGVYLPYSVQNGTPTFNGGGIYVQGNAGVKLSTTGTSGQVFTITQGSTVTTITINPSTNTTSVVSGGTTLNITGVPQQIDPATNAVIGPSTMLYVNGSITSLSGPGQGQPAIQDASSVTVTAANNVTITGDILYKTEPVTLTQNQIPNTPADTLIPGNNNGQALGIFTANGDIQLNNSQANGNLEIDASLATICATGTGGCTGNGGLVNTGNSINTLTIVGGRIQNQIKNINTTTRNVYFDRRFAQGGFSPPWFPSTTVSLGTVTGGAVTAVAQRIQWINQTSYF